MSQSILDPQNIQDRIGEISEPRLPRAARRFGFVPNFKGECKPGDLILFRRAVPNIADRVIIGMQRAGGFSDDDSCWTHAGVYLYDDLVAEAVPFKGIRTRSLYSDIPHKVIGVRRQAIIDESDSHQDEIARYKVALRASQMIGARYSLGAALWVGWHAARGFWNHAAFPFLGRAVICSQVFHDAHLEITKTLLEGCLPGNIVTPVHLSATRSLEDVRVGWLELI